MKTVKKNKFPYGQELVMLLILVLLSITIAVAILTSRKVDEVTPNAGENVPISVESILVETIDSFPIEATVKVSGIQDDACPGTYHMSQNIHSNTIDLDLTRTREDVKCVPIKTKFQETFPIDILDLKKGTYTVNLQNATAEFVLSIDNTITLSDENVALELYPITEKDFYTGHIFYPKVPTYLSKYKDEIVQQSTKGPNSAGSYFAYSAPEAGYGIFYLPTGQAILSEQGNFEIFFDEHSLLFVVNDKDTNVTKYYLLNQKGTKPELVTTIQK